MYHEIKQIVKLLRLIPCPLNSYDIFMYQHTWSFYIYYFVIRSLTALVNIYFHHMENFFPIIRFMIFGWSISLNKCATGVFILSLSWDCGHSGPYDRMCTWHVISRCLSLNHWGHHQDRLGGPHSTGCWSCDKRRVRISEWVKSQRSPSWSGWSWQTWVRTGCRYCWGRRASWWRVSAPNNLPRLCWGHKPTLEYNLETGHCCLKAFSSNDKSIDLMSLMQTWHFQ